MLSTIDLSGVGVLAKESELVTGDLRELLLAMAGGRAQLDGGALLAYIAGKAAGALLGSLKTFTLILVPALLTGVLAALRDSFRRPFVSVICEYAGFALVAAVLTGDLVKHVSLANAAVTDMGDAIQTIFPVLITLLVAVGGTASAAMFQPAVAWAGGTMTSLIKSVTLPFSMGMAVLTMVDGLTDEPRFIRLKRLFRQVAHWTLGVGFTVFLSVTMAQGLGAAAVDGVGVRTAKYALDNFVPIVGGMFADTVDTLVGCSLLVKNAVGLLGLLLIAGKLITPAVQTLLSALLYRAAAALIEPLGTKRLARVIDDFAEVLMLLFVVEMSVGAMLMLLIAQVLVVGNWTVMMR